MPQAEVPKPSTNTNLKMTQSSDGKESYVSGSVTSNAPPPTTAIATAPVQPEPLVEEEDDLSASVEPGTICRRKGCGVAYESDEVNRIGDGEGTVCVYHSAPVGTT